jgi:hypothetical protein
MKLKRSQMSAVHFCDVLRLLLLRKYGGVWIDATVLLTGTPEWFPDEEFFCLIFVSPLLEGPSMHILQRGLSYSAS